MDTCADVRILAPPEAASLVTQLKAEADRHWWINPNRSLELAEQIVLLGEARGEPQHTALGLMARGDALKLLGRTDDAWAALDMAGALFRTLGDEVGWARTRIGRLLICANLGRVAEALADATVARAILSAAGALDKRLVLDMNTAIVHHLLGDYQRSLELYQAALESAETSPAIGGPWLGPIHTNLGYVYDLLGRFRQAEAHYGQARQHFTARGEMRGLAMVDLNSAHIAMAQAHYRQALHLLQQAHSYYTAEGLALDATRVNADRVECYLLLNRFAEARELAREVCRELRAAGATYWEALALLNLATAEARLGGCEESQAALTAAEAIFEGLNSATWAATARLRRGKVALLQGRLDLAEREVRGAAETFRTSGRQADYSEALLLHGQTLLATGQTDAAAEVGAYALRVARRCNLPHLRYSAHLHCGHVAASRGQTSHAARAYMAAIATIERVQQGLTITLRPGFLVDKGEAMHALMALHLRAGQSTRAFELLERAKSQTLLSYIANRDQLRWPTDDPLAEGLIQTLNQLRGEHHWLYARANGQPDGPEEAPALVNPDEARTRLDALERRMRATAEQLHLLTDPGRWGGSMPSQREVQGHLADDEALVEFYTDGARLWAFTLTRAGLAVTALALTPQVVAASLDQLQLNLQATLRVGPRSPLSRRLANIAQGLLGQLYQGLIEPLAQQLGAYRRLLVVPYGTLHYVPFHLLHDGRSYLIERQEVVILPAAGLVTRQATRQPPGAVVLAHSAEGRLPHTADEARSVGARFGGVIYAEGAAVRAALGARAAQILHIAAHGEHRLDQPDLSYVQLADGQLYADDLMQHDLSYELVTLSACETGRAAVAAGDELIGLGRSLLYAGAGALITSLWQVADGTTAELMEQLYTALHAGATKSAALRAAQRALLEAQPGMHPAFWGAFQLVGDPRPLSGPRP